MKLKIKVKVINEECMPVIYKNGDWFDLRSATNISIPAPQASTLKRKTVEDGKVGYRNIEIPTYYIPLGVAMQLPKGFEAIVDSRSSGPKKFGLFIPNGQGVIDNSYNGNDDQWYYVCSPMRETAIKVGDRVCQFRIQLSQRATMWQKIKWLFSSGVEFVKVDSLKDTNRGGLGSSGIK